MVLGNRCYVYILYREDGLTPFYVGKGTGRRWQAHERVINTTEKSYKASIIRKIIKTGCQLKKVKYAEELTHQEAIDLEIELIAKFKRKCDGGPLANLTLGGDGGL